MKEISALAEDLGVQLNLEVVNRFENYLINTCDEVMRYIADVIDRVCHTAALRRAETFCGVIADMQKIIRSGLRPANEH